MLEGRSDALYFLLENRSWNDHPLAGIAINKDERRYHEADAYNTFRDRLGSTAVEEYFQRLGLDCGLVLQVPAASVRDLNGMLIHVTLIETAILNLLLKPATLARCLSLTLSTVATHGSLADATLRSARKVPATQRVSEQLK